MHALLFKVSLHTQPAMRIALRLKRGCAKVTLHFQMIWFWLLSIDFIILLCTELSPL